MRGRYPAGPEYVDTLAASPQAKKRTKMILQTVFSGLRGFGHLPSALPAVA